MATKEEQRQFIERVGALAAADMQASGVLASLTIAQAILESGWGTSELATKANALFGIKADGRWPGKAYSKETKECYDGVSYTTVTALFRAYGSWEESVNDHSDFLVCSARYAAVIGEKDYRKAAEAIKAAGYATAPDYAEKLVRLIETYGLTTYDGAGEEEHTMSNSPLVNYTKISPHRTSPRRAAIKKITIHHMAGNISVETCGNVFSGTREASSNYGVGTDGRVGMYVEEKDRSWASSSPDNDNQAVTIEVANDVTGGNWHVSDTALEKTIELCVDICKRNGISRLNYTGDKSGNLTMHKWFAPTDCPGPYLESKFPYIAEQVNKRLGSSAVEQPGETTPSTGGAAFSVGDAVRFKGGAHYKSSNAASAAGTPAAGPAKVTAISAGAKHPYHIIHTDTTSTVYGWVDASTLEALTGGSTEGSTYTVQAGDTLWGIATRLLGNGNRYTEIKALNGLTSDTIRAGQKLKIPGGSTGGSAPEPAKTAQVGSTVRLKSGAKTYTGGGLSSFVYERDHIIKELKGDRAVITYCGVTVAAVHVSDLIVK